MGRCEGTPNQVGRGVKSAEGDDDQYQGGVGVVFGVGSNGGLYERLARGDS